jgi:hypothetical protein
MNGGSSWGRTGPPLEISTWGLCKRAERTECRETRFAPGTGVVVGRQKSMMLRNQQLAIERVQSGEATLRHAIFGVSAAAVIPASLHAKVIILPCSIALPSAATSPLPALALSPSPALLPLLPVSSLSVRLVQETPVRSRGRPVIWAISPAGTTTNPPSTTAGNAETCASRSRSPIRFRSRA